MRVLLFAVVSVLTATALAGCLEPPRATGVCAPYQGPDDRLLVHYLGPDEETYDQWSTPEWSEYTVTVERYGSNGDTLWQHEGRIIDGCAATPLDGAGDYHLTASAPVDEDRSCTFTNYEGFSFNGTGVLELERQIGAVCE